MTEAQYDNFYFENGMTRDNFNGLVQTWLATLWDTNDLPEPNKTIDRFQAEVRDLRSSPLAEYQIDKIKAAAEKRYRRDIDELTNLGEKFV